jgi:hypothetical protein
MRALAGILAFSVTIIIAAVILVIEWIKKRKHSC